METWNIVVNSGEIRRVPFFEAVQGDLLTWKLAMWGSPRDARLLQSLKSRFPSLSDYCLAKEIIISLGFQKREGPAAGVEYVPELFGKRMLDMDALWGCGRIFSFANEAKPEITKEFAYVRKRGGKKGIVVSRPPHVILDVSRRFAV
jgi:hypothetical protein